MDNIYIFEQLLESIPDYGKIAILLFSTRTDADVFTRMWMLKK